MKRAFTLVELLVVIGIIGILVGVLLTSFSGSSESARAAQCLSNMRNLATAVNTMAMNSANQRDAYYPFAQTKIVMDIQTSKRTGTRKRYQKDRGWIDMYPGEAGWKDTMSSAGRIVTAYDDDDKATDYVITNGAVWATIGRKEGYVCPSHRLSSANRPPAWSYMMNSYFASGIPYGSLKNADRMLLFAELPFGAGDGETLADPLLDYKKNEIIGFNHTAAGKRCAHVAFADGHVEKLRTNIKFKKGVRDDGSNSEFKELTEWLCTGVDFTFNGQKYQKLEK